MPPDWSSGSFKWRHVCKKKLEQLWRIYVIMVTVFASLTLKWPWHDLQIAFGWYSSKSQPHPMSNCITSCYGSTSKCFTMLHNCNLARSTKYWGRSIISGIPTIPGVSLFSKVDIALYILKCVWKIHRTKNRSKPVLCKKWLHINSLEIDKTWTF